MIQRAHSVKSVSGVVRAGSYSRSGRLQVGIRVANAATHASPRGFRNYLHCSLHFRGNGHYLDVSTGRLPVTFKSGESGWHQVFGWMNPAPGMADERSLQMNAERTRAESSTFSSFNSFCQPIQGTQNVLFRCGNGGRQVGSHSMLCQEGFEAGESLRVWFHHVVAHAAMNVDIEVSRGQHRAGKIEAAGAFRDLSSHTR